MAVPMMPGFLRFAKAACVADAMLVHGIPEHIRSDSGLEMTTKVVRDWLQRIGSKTLFIEPGSPWENGYCESFNGKLQDELLNGEIFYSLKEATVVIEQWRKHYNQKRPPSALGYKPHGAGDLQPKTVSPQCAPSNAVTQHSTWYRKSVGSR